MINNGQEVLKCQLLLAVCLQRIDLHITQKLSGNDIVMVAESCVHGMLGGSTHQLSNDLQCVWCRQLKPSHHHDLSYLLSVYSLCLIFSRICA